MCFVVWLVRHVGQEKAARPDRGRAAMSKVRDVPSSQGPDTTGPLDDVALTD
jgi:hypothetical protein